MFTLNFKFPCFYKFAPFIRLDFHLLASRFHRFYVINLYYGGLKLHLQTLYLAIIRCKVWKYASKHDNYTSPVSTVKVKQSRYRPGVAQRVPGS